MHTFTIFDFFNLCAGLAIFLYGMQQGEKTLQQIGGSDLKRIISVITRHRISAYFAGFFITMVTQSSSATTVMLVGLASANIMSLSQSLGMILGSDLATTFTVQLFAFKFYQIAPLLIAAGYTITLISKKERTSGYGTLLFSLGLIFFGMYMMAQSVSTLHNNTIFMTMITASFNNPWYGLLTGTIITATIHSSAATLAIVITLAEALQGSSHQSLTITNLLPIVLGANLGTCATALLSTIKADLEGTRVAWAHLCFKFTGILIVFPCTGLLKYFENQLIFSPAIQIAALHTAFNLLISLLCLPFLYYFDKLIRFLIQPGKSDSYRFQTRYLNENAIHIPVVAISQTMKEITRMAELVLKMTRETSKIINNYSEDEVRRIKLIDDEVDFLYQNIVSYITRISRQALNSTQISQAYGLIMISADIEHIGDISSKNLTYLCSKIINSPSPLSATGKSELLDFYNQACANFTEIIIAFTNNDITLANSILSRKSKSKQMFEKLFENHMERLYSGITASLQTTSIHKDLLEETQRINHFTFRIADHIIKGVSQGILTGKSSAPSTVTIPVIDDMSNVNNQ
jgi:phosphate:Na+ symporter